MFSQTELSTPPVLSIVPLLRVCMGVMHKVSVNSARICRILPEYTQNFHRIPIARDNPIAFHISSPIWPLNMNSFMANATEWWPHDIRRLGK
jgi:hypothetical protein